MKLVSIIIPTFTATEKLSNLLSQLESQTINNTEIIIIDSSGMDDISKLSQSHRIHLIWIDPENFDHGRTRTLGAKEAQGDILVFLSQDVLPCNEHSIQNLVDVLEKNEGVSMVYGRQIPYPQASPFAAHLRIFNYSPSSYVRQLQDKHQYGLKTIFFSNAFAAYRKKDLADIGYFPDGLIFGEDTYVAAKMLLRHKTIAYTAEAQVFHSHNYTIGQEFKRYFDIGVFHRNQNWLLKEFGKPDRQGWNYLRSEMLFLHHQHQHGRYGECLLRSAVKWLGYKTGASYPFLPRKICRFLSMNPNWWNQR